MRVHPRTEICRKAEERFRKFMLTLERDHDLTPCETFQMINRYQADMLKYALREERHIGEEGKGGDEK